MTAKPGVMKLKLNDCQVLLVNSIARKKKRNIVPYSHQRKDDPTNTLIFGL
jgi:hypothetical protein